MGAAYCCCARHGGEPVNPFRSDLSRVRACVRGWRGCVLAPPFLLFAFVFGDGRRVLAAHCLVVRARMVVAQSPDFSFSSSQLCSLRYFVCCVCVCWLLAQRAGVRSSHDDTNPAPLLISTSMSRNPSGLLMAYCVLRAVHESVVVAAAAWCLLLFCSPFAFCYYSLFVVSIARCFRGRSRSSSYHVEPYLSIFTAGRSTGPRALIVFPPAFGFSTNRHSHGLRRDDPCNHEIDTESDAIVA